MGRLSGKRKLKQCDPFFKGTRAKGKKEQKYDLAPTTNVSKRKRKRQNRSLNQDKIDREVLGHSAIKDDSASAAAKNFPTLDLECKRPNESFKAFNKRLRSSVQQTLKETTRQGLKSTSKKKAYFEKQKLKKKRSRMTDQERYEMDFQKTGDSRQESFAGAERISFGDRYDAPPAELGRFFKRSRK